MECEVCKTKFNKLPEASPAQTRACSGCLRDLTRQQLIDRQLNTVDEQRFGLSQEQVEERFGKPLKALYRTKPVKVGEWERVTKLRQRVTKLEELCKETGQQFHWQKYLDVILGRKALKRKAERRKLYEYH